MPTSSPSMPSSPPPATSTPSGTSATSSATGPDPDGVVARLAAIGAIGVAGNHDRAALGGPEIDWFNADARAAMDWTRAPDRDRPRRLAGGPPGHPDRGGRSASSTAARATRSGSTSLTAAIARANLERPRDTARPLRPHPPADGLDARGGRIESDRSRTDAPFRASTARPGPAQPGQRRPAARRRPAGRLARARHGRRRGHAGAASTYDVAAVQAAMRGGRPADPPGRAARVGL